jgi:phage shock protein B
VDDILVPIVLFGTLFIGLPWLILHYTTKWRSTAGALTTEDENLLDELYDTARRLEDRLHTVERIVAADHPDWRPAVRADDEQDRLDYRPERRSTERSN